MFCEGLLLARAECPMPAHCNVKRQLAFMHQWAPCPKMDTGGLFQERKKKKKTRKGQEYVGTSLCRK